MEHVDEALIAEARDAFEEMAAISSSMGGESGELSTADLMRWEAAHRRFHFTLISRCGSPWLQRLVNVLYENSIRYRYLTLEWDPNSMANALKEHRRILEAFASGDIDASVQMLTEHMRLTVESVENVPALEATAEPDNVAV
jgi:DNA-binding GntR family transcriptional regulator